MRILLATDGSPQARGAEAMAEWLSYKLAARLLVLHVQDTRLIRTLELLDLGALSIPWPAYRSELQRALAVRAEAILERIKQEGETVGLEMETLSEAGLPHEVILKHARAADLLVLGRSGEAHAETYTGLGSTAERILRLAPIPVWLSPPDPQDLREAVLGYNASPSAVRALHALAPLAQGLGLPVRVVSLHENPKQAATWVLEAEAYLRERNIPVEGLALSGEASEYLLSQAKPGVLLALGAPVRRLVLGSTAERVLRGAQSPVLSVR